MSLILAIESSGKNCSVAVGDKDSVLSSRELISERYIHSEKLHLFIVEVCREAGIKLRDLKAVAVDRGPGSYTGLRIGTAAAKGLCYTLNIPLVSITATEILAAMFIQKQQPESDELIVSMLDARRMEVYAGIYNSKREIVKDISALVLTEDSFSEMEAEKYWLVGDGAEKALDVLPSGKFFNGQISQPSATAIIPLAHQLVEKGITEDTAYFEPFYLKDFIAGKPRKLL